MSLLDCNPRFFIWAACTGKVWSPFQRQPLCWWCGATASMSITGAVFDYSAYWSTIRVAVESLVPARMPIIVDQGYGKDYAKGGKD